LLKLTLAEEAPSGWTSYKSYCTGGQAAGCHSAHFSTDSTSYNKVCGKIKGYQKGNVDGFFPSAYAHRKVNYYNSVTSS